MSGDSKIGPVGNVARTGPLRRIGSDAAAPAALQAAPETLPTARLTRLAGTLADMSPPVDVARVATLRTAIANGSYGVHPAIIASAMIDFHTGGAE